MKQLDQAGLQVSLGGRVRKGERGTTVVYADRFVPKDEKRRADCSRPWPSGRAFRCGWSSTEIWFLCPVRADGAHIMTKLKLGLPVDDKPVKLTIELSAQVHRDLMAYADVLAAESGQVIDPGKLIAPMLARFMATDRAFAKARRKLASREPQSPRASR
jgi:hypothetical protein